MVLSLIRQFFTAEMVIHITDDFAAPRVLKLNKPITDASGNIIKDDKGEPLLENDVRTGVFDVHVEEVKDVLSSRELELNQLNMLMQAGIKVPSKLLIEATSIKNKEALINSISPTPSDMEGTVNERQL